MQKKGRGELRITTLTETAADMFLKLGYDAVSVDALIAGAGGSRRNVYDHFGGKEGLFITAVSSLCKEISLPLQEIALEGNTPRAALEAFGTRVLEIVLQPRTLALHRLMIAEGERFPGLSKAIWESGPQNAITILGQWIGRHQASGSMRNDIVATDLAAQFIHALVSGPQLQALAGIISLPLERTEMSRIAALCAACFLDGCVVKGNGRHA